MARASTATLLSLDRYAQIVGINPAHFNGGATDTIMGLSPNACQDTWWQYSWQAYDRVSREDLAQSIGDAERDIAEVLGWWPAPVWTTEEVVRYPRHHRPDVISYGLADVRGYSKSVHTEWGNVIGGGRRGIDCEKGQAVVYTPALPAYQDTATITVAGLTWTDVREIKVYFAGHSGEREWEIRPAKTKTLTGGTFTAVFWSWQLIDPDIWDALTNVSDSISAIDLTDPANYVATVDVCREYNDVTEVASEFYWEPQSASVLPCAVCGGTGCASCALTTQDGCLHVRDAPTGMVVPATSTYDVDEEAWEPDAQDICRDPDFVKVWYYSGLIANDYLAETSHDALSNYWAQTIAWLATARLERPPCACSNTVTLFAKWSQDLAIIGGDEGHLLSERLLDNPLGTRRGEIMTWNRVSRMARRKGKVALI
jgi:hypothetical protein